MASATARPTFSFHIQTPTSLSKPKTHLPIPLIHHKKPIIQPPLKHPRTRLSLSSVDVSKEDKPVSEKPESPQTPDDSTPDEEKEKFDRRRLEERFAVLNTGIYECRSCGYRYDEAAGDPSYPVPPGMEFGKLPEDWRCATCGAAKSFFESKSVEIAGFAQNQQFGLGGNALTAGQKAILIYGSLFLFFVLFLSGYFLQ
ncbi:uncharacterized protein LOC131231292 [Magnolia sinica]|uniref:uncharacterized protein LOC131231292 n=1 Tax=Magnolia sinica TaxID=86752 RepID=UPI00265AD369|nr:uncharacterized protein LOC131231292 [Magnolia sinica]XP_058083418.1 uncharacterized protein LOC131231292 [Magnolia sinica]